MRILGSFFLFLFLAVVVLIAIANRHAVLFSLDPLPFDFVLPVYLLIFIGLFFGLLGGWAVALYSGWRYQRRLAGKDKQIKQLEKQLETLPTATDHDKTTPRLSA